MNRGKRDADDEGESSGDEEYDDYNDDTRWDIIQQLLDQNWNRIVVKYDQQSNIWEIIMPMITQLCYTFNFFHNQWISSISEKKEANAEDTIDEHPHRHHHGDESVCEQEFDYWAVQFISLMCNW